MRPLCVYDDTSEDSAQETLNNCCPDGYNAVALSGSLPDDPQDLTCIEELFDCALYNDAKKDCNKNTGDACIYDNRNKKCVPKATGAPLSSKVDAEDPVKMKSSSDRAGLKISAMLVGIFLMLWN